MKLVIPAAMGAVLALGWIRPAHACGYSTLDDPGLEITPKGLRFLARTVAVGRPGAQILSLSGVSWGRGPVYSTVPKPGGSRERQFVFKQVGGARELHLFGRRVGRVNGETLQLDGGAQFRVTLEGPRRLRSARSYKAVILRNGKPIATSDRMIVPCTSMPEDEGRRNLTQRLMIYAAWRELIFPAMRDLRGPALTRATERFRPARSE